MKDNVVKYEKRINTLIRDFVAIYKKLAEDFGKFKEYARVQVKVLEAVISKKDKCLEKQLDEIKDFKMALKVPRLHYKHIENLRYEEMMS